MTTCYEEIDEPMVPTTSSSYMGDEGASSSNNASESLGPDLINGNCRVSMENFALIRVLGKGAYGKVFLVRKIGGPDSGKIYAMKVLKKSRAAVKQKTLEHTITERKALERLKGKPYLVDMVYAFQTETKLHIVMTFACGGELFAHLCRHKHFSYRTTKAIVAELVVAIETVHKYNVIFRDLKLENILVDEDGHIALADFGLSKLYSEEELPWANSYCGTIEYMPPEIIRRTDYNECVDWWSLGVVTFELLTGCSPFTQHGSDNSVNSVSRRILNGCVPHQPHQPQVTRDFIDALLTKNPLRRLGAGGVEEIKRHEFFQGVDWKLVEEKKAPPPLKPMIANSVDLHNFPPEFINQPPILSPADCARDYQDVFRGYSFISPSVIFSNDNIIGEEFLSENVKTLMESSPFFAKYDLDTSAEGFLGRGTFSICRKCTRRSDGKAFAVKIVSQKFAHHAMREIRILEMLNPHENIVTMVDAMSDALHYYIVLELLKGGELLQTLRKMVKFTEFQAARIMAQLVHAVSHIHAKGIVHRDLKPENILFVDTDENVHIRLVDFGFARVLPKNSGNSSGGSENLVTPCCGTLFYAAPEVLELEDELPQYNQQCDLWSLGVILFTMLSGKIPFRARSHTESAADVIKRIRDADFSFDDPVWESVDEQAKNLITGLLTVDPKKRLSLRQLALHHWLTNSDINCSRELQTPNALPSLADETFNETMDAFITANRDGFHLMDVDTAPLLVKRRGMKRHMEKDVGGGSANSGHRKSSILQAVPENSVLRNNFSNSDTQSSLSQELASAIVAPQKRPNTITLNAEDMELPAVSPFSFPTNDMIMASANLAVSSAHNPNQATPTTVPTPSSTFTEYRDTRPSYLKYSSDDYVDVSSGSIQNKLSSDSNSN